MSFVATGLAREILTGTPPVLKTLWEGVSLSVEPGEVLFVVGPSGTGKSLLLRCLAGLDGLKAGTLTLAGKSPEEVGGFQHWRTEVLYCSQARWAFPGSPASTFEDVKARLAAPARPPPPLPHARRRSSSRRSAGARTGSSSPSQPLSA